MIFSDDLEPHPPRYLIRRIELSLQAPLTECIRPLSSLFDPKDECDRKKTLFFFVVDLVNFVELIKYLEKNIQILISVSTKEKR